MWPKAWECRCRRCTAGSQPPRECRCYIIREAPSIVHSGHSDLERALFSVSRGEPDLGSIKPERSRGWQADSNFSFALCAKRRPSRLTARSTASQVTLKPVFCFLAPLFHFSTGIRDDYECEIANPRSHERYSTGYIGRAMTRTCSRNQACARSPVSLGCQTIRYGKLRIAAGGFTIESSRIV